MPGDIRAACGLAQALQGRLQPAAPCCCTGLFEALACGIVIQGNITALCSAATHKQSGHGRTMPLLSQLLLWMGVQSYSGELLACQLASDGVQIMPTSFHFISIRCLQRSVPVAPSFQTLPHQLQASQRHFMHAMAGSAAVLCLFQRLQHYI